MAIQVYFENQRLTVLDEVKHASCLKQRISEQYGVPVSDLFVTVNGRIATESLLFGTVRINYRLVGGKGGFGSMLRAIGAQIEKTTNREACRDLSGRRLRDINEEKRLRKWLEGQSDREREAAERKQKKLERLMAEPRVETKLNDPVYEKERQELPERVSAAVDAGWIASTSEGKSTSLKRKSADTKQKAKKSKLWIDADLSECSSSDDNDEDDVEEKNKTTSDSGNESGHTSEVKKCLWSLTMLALLSLVLARPNEFDDEYDNNDNNNNNNQAEDRNDDVSRVQIKVYRGPTNHDGHAPWGFWVKQPTDDE